MTDHLPPKPYRLGERYGLGRHFQDILDANRQVIARVKVTHMLPGNLFPQAYPEGMALAAWILKLGKETEQ